MKPITRVRCLTIQITEFDSYNADFVLDTREIEEYKASHLAGSYWVGYESFRLDKIDSLVRTKNKRIVVYCSVGVRSEDIGEKLLQQGYTDVRNLYGGIFEWKNQGRKVVDSSGLETQNVHAYSKFWGRLLTDANKVY